MLDYSAPVVMTLPDFVMYLFFIIEIVALCTDWFARTRLVTARASPGMRLEQFRQNPVWPTL